MKFILEVFKLSIVVLSGVIILYITEWVRYGCVENFLDFLKDVYPYTFVIAVFAILAKEKIDH
ncbi:hypothetical protein [Haemophilus sp.]